MYLEMAEEEDKKLAESWQADADGILTFVCLHLPAPCFTPSHHASFVDRFILCCRCIIDLCIDPGHSAEPTGYLKVTQTRSSLQKRARIRSFFLKASRIVTSRW